MHIKWENGFKISTSVREGEIAISANRQGLLSLANILVDLAGGQPGDHVHLDEHNSLEDGSNELIVELVEG